MKNVFFLFNDCTARKAQIAASLLQPCCLAVIKPISGCVRIACSGLITTSLIQVALTACSKSKSAKGLIPRQRNSSRETVYAKYGWLSMNDSIEFSHFFSPSHAASRTEFYSLAKRIFAREERIQWNYSCATIRISHK